MDRHPRVANRAPAMSSVNARGAGRAPDALDAAITVRKADATANFNEQDIELFELELFSLGPRLQPDKTKASFIWIVIDLLQQPVPCRKQKSHIAEKPCPGPWCQNPEALFRHGCQGQHRPGGVASIHAGDAVIAGAAKAFSCLQTDQREQPVFRLRAACYLPFKVMVLRGDRQIELVGRGDTALQFHSIRHWRLHEGGFRPVLHHEAPWLVARKAGREPPQELRPLCFPLRNFSTPRLMQSERCKLHEEHVPEHALMRPERRKTLHFITR